MTTTAELDTLFLALADPTRREVIRQLGGGPASVGVLAQAFPMTLPSFLKHVRALEASGVISTQKSGRTRICTLEHHRLDAVDGWLADQRRLWEARTDRMADVATTLEGAP